MMRIRTRRGIQDAGSVGRAWHVAARGGASVAAAGLILSLVAFAADPVMPDDPLLSRQWHLLRLEMPEVWGLGHTRVDRTRIAILSTGIDWMHRDLLSNVHANLGEGVVTGVQPGGIVVVRFAGESRDRSLMADVAPIRKR